MFEDILHNVQKQPSLVHCITNEYLYLTCDQYRDAECKDR